MKQSTNAVSITIIISLLLFILTYVFYDGIFNFILPTVNRGTYLRFDAISELKISLLFCFAISVIPMVIAGTWAFAPINAGNNRFLSLIIILLCVMLSIYFRQQSIKDYFVMMSDSTAFNTPYSLTETYFEYYILGGLGGGFVISYLLFAEK